MIVTAQREIGQHDWIFVIKAIHFTCEWQNTVYIKICFINASHCKFSTSLPITVPYLEIKLPFYITYTKGFSKQAYCFFRKQNIPLEKVIKATQSSTKYQQSEDQKQVQSEQKLNFKTSNPKVNESGLCRYKGI